MRSKKFKRFASKVGKRRGKENPLRFTRMNELLTFRFPGDPGTDENAKVGSYITLSILNPEARAISNALCDFNTVPGETVMALARAERDRAVGMVVQWSSPLEAFDAVRSVTLDSIVKSMHRGLRSVVTYKGIPD